MSKADTQLDLFGGAPRAGDPVLPRTTSAAPLALSSLSQPTQDARQLLLRLGFADLATELQIVWNPRMRSTAGMAYPGRSLITLNPRLQSFGWEEIERTLRHELAHLLAHARAGRRRIAPHGPEWKQACLDVGLTDEKRCHSLPLPRRVVPIRHRYQCPHCRALVERVRPFRRKSACLRCCRRHNGGRYDERYRFRAVPLVAVGP